MDVSDILREFCALSDEDREAQFDAYLQRLDEAYDSNEPVLKFPEGCSPGLETIGGCLLSQFIQRHPDIEVINLRWHGLTDEGLQLLIEGLRLTREVGKLHELELSCVDLSEALIRLLARQVFSNHSSLRIIGLEMAGLRDEHIKILFSETTNSQITKFNLTNNNIRGKSFIEKKETLFQVFPNLNWINLTSNDLTKPAQVVLLELLDAYRDLFIRYPTSREIQERSLRNHREFFRPNRERYFVISINYFFNILYQFMPNQQQLTDNSGENRLADVERKLQEIVLQQEQDRNEFLEKLLEQEIAATMHDLELRQMINAISARQEHFSTLLNEVNLNYQSIQKLSEEMDERIQDVEKRDKSTGEIVKNLKNITEANVKTLKNHEKRIVEIQQSAQGLAEKWTKILEEKPIQAVEFFSPAQIIYIRTFRKIVVGMYAAARVISTGAIDGKVPNSLVLQALQAVSFMAPLGTGVAFHLLASLVKKVNRELMLQRMRRLNDLGSYENEVVELADQLSHRLVKYGVSLENPVDDTYLSRFLSTAEQLLSLPDKGATASLETIKNMLRQETFALYQAFSEVMITKAVSYTASKSSDQTVDEKAMQIRATCDANVFLTAIAKSSVPPLEEMRQNRLYLYAFPLITIVDHVYWEMLIIFCRQEAEQGVQVDVEKIETDATKRKQFSAWMANSFHHHADRVASHLDERREYFVRHVANTFQDQPHEESKSHLQIFGMFFIKQDERKALQDKPNKNKLHLSWSHVLHTESSVAESVSRVALLFTSP